MPSNWFDDLLYYTTNHDALGDSATVAGTLRGNAVRLRDEGKLTDAQYADMINRINLTDPSGAGGVKPLATAAQNAGIESPTDAFVKSISESPSRISSGIGGTISDTLGGFFGSLSGTAWLVLGLALAAAGFVFVMPYIARKQ